MEIGSSFNNVFNTLMWIFNWFFNQLGTITIGGVSLLIINLSLTVFLLIITATITVVRSGSVSSVRRVDKAKKEKSMKEVN